MTTPRDIIIKARQFVQRMPRYPFKNQVNAPRMRRLFREAILWGRRTKR